jgi:hypothetical protein
VMPKGTYRGMAAMTGIALAIQGCRDGEQSRPLTYDKGVYRGPLIKGWMTSRSRCLSQRTARQRF